MQETEKKLEDVTVEMHEVDADGNIASKAAVTDFRKDCPVPHKENTIGIACRESIVRHHQNRGSEIFIDTLDRREASKLF